MSLVLRSVLCSAIDRTGLAGPVARVTGAGGPVRALAVAAAANRLSAGAVLAVVPTDADIDTAVDDVRFFLGALEGHAEAAVNELVLPFPSTQVDPYRAFAPHLKVASARARALHALAAGAARVVVASAPSLLPRLPDPAALLLASFDVRPGIDVAPDELANTLVVGGYEPADPVDAHGEFCRRGGILDVFPAGEDLPVRIEFIGDTVESVRRFDPATQRSVETLDRFGIVPVREMTNVTVPGTVTSDLFQFLRTRDSEIWIAEPADVQKQIETTWEQVQASHEAHQARSEGRTLPPPGSLMLSWPDVERALTDAHAIEELAVEGTSGVGSRESGADQSGAGSRTVRLSAQPAASFRGRIQDWVADMRDARTRGDVIVFVAGTRGRAERAVELLHDYEIPAVMAAEVGDATSGVVIVAEGLLSRGFRLRTSSPQALKPSTLQLYSENDVFEEERRRGPRGRRGEAGRARSLAATFLSDLRDLKVGDLIVHVDHGIGQFVGLKQLSVAHGDVVQEFLELRYQGDSKLFVPVERLDLVQKYTGGTRPPLDRLGGTTWERAKKKVKKAMRDMAEELLKLYAARKAVPGHAFGADTHWQQEFEDAFEYELTPDQTTAIADIKRDMESPTPMDRLLCGDVGYGKTEVAMRAAFKAVMDGKQAAFLAPTTVLAAQHLKTLRTRFAAFPARIEMVSRFRTKQEIKDVLTDLAAGRVDIIVGTHRLLSKDVVFRDLGLLVVDEEQRFGVAHKERIKQLRKKVDVLTMTATPIPRTLNMSLVGIRDMSVIETPPKDRLAIQTIVVKFDAPVITRAIRQELARGGQVFFVHNRVESIYSMGNLVQRLVPDARVATAHGQMAEDSLERTMLDFMDQKYDVLLATTIVENGLDIPNANTIVVNRADRYGLAQLYQLRGRVGRSDRAAYAYLLIPPEDSLSPVARKRLAAIKEFSDLGSGFRVAALDLEIRGAGNLLGGEQSGHIDAVGFEMYMQLLEESIRELKGEELEEAPRAAVNLKVDLRLDESYVPDMNQRLMLYRRVAAARSEEEIGRIVDEVRDRYGPTPAAMLNLADFGRIRVLADRLGLDAVDRDGPFVVFRFRDKTPVDPMHILKLIRARDDLQIVPPNTVKLDLRLTAYGVRRTAYGSRRTAYGVRPQAVRPKPYAPSRTPQAASPQAASRTPSWWTARATAGVVAPGFTKEEMLRPAPEDPRAPGGVLARVTELLEELEA
jgi:transcription-repair coupling factor (superfamily II helicase)